MEEAPFPPTSDGLAPPPIRTERRVVAFPRNDEAKVSTIIAALDNGTTRRRPFPAGGGGGDIGGTMVDALFEVDTSTTSSCRGDVDLTDVVVLLWLLAALLLLRGLPRVPHAGWESAGRWWWETLTKEEEGVEAKRGPRRSRPVCVCRSLSRCSFFFSRANWVRRRTLPSIFCTSSTFSIHLQTS